MYGDWVCLLRHIGSTVRSGICALKVQMYDLNCSVKGKPPVSVGLLASAKQWFSTWTVGCFLVLCGHLP